MERGPATHAVLQGLAFLVLYPLGALVAVFRNYIGESWRALHVTIQLLATACVFMALAAVHIRSKPMKTDSKYRSIHKILGPLVVLLILTQFVWAYYGRMLVEWNTWYYIHMLLSMSIISVGIANLYIGAKMTGYF